MYVFVGLNVSEFFPKIKDEIKRIEEKLEYKNNLSKLPLHISLKMSFEISDDKLDNVLDELTLFFKDLTPIMVVPKEIENDNGICWIRMDENKRLNLIHDKLNTLLQNKFNVPLHEYDLDYKFHTTLFLDKDINKVNESFELIKEEVLPVNIFPEEILIGVSPNGDVGSYEIIRRIFI